MAAAPPDLATVYAQLDAPRPASSPSLPHPSLATWQPLATANIAIKIARDGQWYYHASPIARPRMVRLFASLLRCAGDAYFLVTPPCQYRIAVEDAPFLAVEVTRQGHGVHQNLYFRTNFDEVIRADAHHPVWLARPTKDAPPQPYLLIRAGLTAKITRAVYYQLAEYLYGGMDDGMDDGIATASPPYMLHSGGAVFDLSQESRTWAE